MAKIWQKIKKNPFELAFKAHLSMALPKPRFWVSDPLVLLNQRATLG